MLKHIVFFVLSCSLIRLAGAADELAIDHVMLQDPTFTVAPSVLRFDPRLKELWLQALAQPDSEPQRLAADTIAIAHQNGMKGLTTAVPELLKVALRKESTPAVRRAAVQALVALDGKEQAAPLAQLSEEHGLPLALMVEPALARWQFEPIREVWRKRIADRDALPRLRLLAIEGAAALRDNEAKPPLLSIVQNAREPNSVRLAAADALQAIGGGEVLDDAQRLLADGKPSGVTNRLLGVRLLGAHRNESAVELLKTASGDVEPAVAAAALRQLFHVAPEKSYALARTVLQNLDVNVRRAGVDILLHRGDAETITAVAPLLDDPNPALRRFITKSLFEFAQQPDLKATVIQVIELTLAGDQWRALEQAALLVGALDHKPAALRMMELLRHGRIEVAVTAAWTLRKLKVPETIPQLLVLANKHYATQLSSEAELRERIRAHEQQTQIFQLFGELKYQEADSLFRNYIPKNFALGEARAAAIWALGKLHEGNTAPDLAKQFSERLADVTSMPPEMELIRRMCAVSLGRIQGESELAGLRMFATDATEAGLACWWSIERLTGEKMPPAKIREVQLSGWFLEPLSK